MNTAALYESDFYAWTQHNAELLQKKRFSELDLRNLIEEVKDMGASEKRALESRLIELLMHLLKWQFQSERRGKSWELTIRNQRRAIELHLKKVPSLKPNLKDTEWLEIIWGDAVYQATKETGLEDFPESCPWAVEDILVQGWLPTNNTNSC